MGNLFRISAIILSIFLIYSCTEDKPAPAVITTTNVSKITQTSATAGGNIVFTEGKMITERGVCWSTNKTPLITDNKTIDGAGEGIFVSRLVGLTLNTTYYVRAYSTNSGITSYGNTVWFTTSPATSASLTTSGITAITQNTAISGGYIFGDGGASVTTRGVCWSTAANPTLADSKTTDGSGTGLFISTISGLQSNTKYYINAYAINSMGTTYGNKRSFTTRGETDTVSDINGTTYSTIVIGTQTWMAENLKTTKYSDGTSIPLINTEASWVALATTSKAYCWYDDNISNKDTYGALYTWAAAMNGAVISITEPSGVQGVCPTGWHLPTMWEWMTLEEYLGGHTIAGGKLKETGTARWSSPNEGATNESGFSGLPGGIRQENGSYVYIGLQGFWWSSTTEYKQLDYAYTESLVSNNLNTILNTNTKKRGFSVRCVKD